MAIRKITTTGNSPSVTINPVMLETLGLKIGDEVDVKLDLEGKITIEKPRRG